MGLSHSTSPGSYRDCSRGLLEGMFIPDISGNNQAKDADGSNRSCHISDTGEGARSKMRVIFDDSREVRVLVFR